MEFSFLLSHDRIYHNVQPRSLPEQTVRPPFHQVPNINNECPAISENCIHWIPESWRFPCGVFGASFYNVQLFSILSFELTYLYEQHLPKLVGDQTFPCISVTMATWHKTSPHNTHNFLYKVWSQLIKEKYLKSGNAIGYKESDHPPIWMCRST